MARIFLFQSVALAAFAAGLAVPAQAQEAGVEAQVVLAAADDQDRGESRGGGGWRSRDPGASGVQAAPERSYRSEANGQGGEQRAQARAEWQQRRAERAQAPQQASPQQAVPQQQAQAQGGGRGWNRGGGGGDGSRWQRRAEAQQQQAAPQQRNAPEGSWRSQRAGDSQRYGRNWDSDGTVNRPAPAWRGATPQTPDRGTAERYRGEQRGEWTQRNRTYSDPNRNGSYRNGYRDGRSAHAYRDGRDQAYSYRNGYNGGYTSGSRDHRRWDRHDWRRDTRYNWSGYRSQHRDLYRAGRYYSPYSNYRYNRLNIGIFLDNGFYGNRYWINDPWQYRLPEVYGPYRWVRYYDDVLLVDIYTGEVVDVIHDFFW